MPRGGGAGGRTGDPPEYDPDYLVYQILLENRPADYLFYIKIDKDYTIELFFYS